MRPGKRDRPQLTYAFSWSSWIYTTNKSWTRPKVGSFSLPLIRLSSFSILFVNLSYSSIFLPLSDSLQTHTKLNSSHDEKYWTTLKGHRRHRRAVVVRDVGFTWNKFDFSFFSDTLWTHSPTGTRKKDQVMLKARESFLSYFVALVFATCIYFIATGFDNLSKVNTN